MHISKFREKKEQNFGKILKKGNIQLTQNQIQNLVSPTVRFIDTNFI